MELWLILMTLDSTKESHRSPPIYLSLVCFLGPSTLLPNSPNYKRVDIAHTKAHEMKQCKSIFDVKDTSSLHCLAAVNYFQDDTKTQVLWLATTLEAPPVDSIHVVWQKHGLATYLLCMLVKQHTGISTIQHSILSLQASHQRNNPVCSFYLKLGFSCHNEFENNGFSQTSKGFQEAVQKFPELWVTTDKVYGILLVVSRVADHVTE